MEYRSKQELKKSTFSAVGESQEGVVPRPGLDGDYVRQARHRVLVNRNVVEMLHTTK
jgi:hypothetical protein